MNKSQRKLSEAEILMQGSNPEQRQRAKELLSVVITEADGTSTAQKARELLEKMEAGRPVERNPEVSKFAQRWSGLQGLTDPNLVLWLRALQNQPYLIAHLRPVVVKDLRNWINQAVPQVADGLSQKELHTVESFVKEVSKIDAYCVDELKPLRKALFELRYQETKSRIETALEEWAIDEAWRLFEELGPTPEDFDTQAQKLQNGIYQVEQLRQEVQDSLSHPPEVTLESWLNMRLLVTLLHRYAGYLSQASLPHNWQRQIKRAMSDGLRMAEEFLKRRASLAVVIKDLRNFWAEYSGLELAGYADRLGLQEDWFRTSLNLILKATRKAVTKAASPSDLKEIGLNLIEQPETLPPVVVGWLKELADEIGVMAANWQAMLSGDEFEQIAKDQIRLTIPSAFKKAAVAYRKDLNQITAAFARIGSGEELSEQLYRESAQIADAILARVPGHNNADKLKKESERGMLYWRLDDSLRHWDLGEFLRLCKMGPAGGIYRDLAKRENALVALGGLAGQPEFTNWRTAAEWWGDWRDAKRELPQPESDWPDSLRYAKRDQEADRCDQWYRVLDPLTNTEMTPEEAQAAADSLEHELVTLDLQGYHRNLIRKATVGRAHRYVDSRQFDLAGAEIARLDEDHEDTLRLRTRLKVEQAGLRSVSEAAGVLFGEWQNVMRYLDNAHAILLHIVEKAWEQEEMGALDKLQKVVNRVLSSEKQETAEMKQLQEWADWLSVEQAIRAETSLLTVRKVADYLRRAEQDRVLHKRLERLVAYWDAQRNTVMLSWAYQTFNRIDPSIMPRPVDPVEYLVAEGSRLADRIFSRLETDKNLQASDLKELQAEIALNDSGWKELKDYLELLNFQENKREQAGRFLAARQLCESLVNVFDTLGWLREKADWRFDTTVVRFNAARVTINLEFDTLAVKQGLLDEMKRWDPLVELKVLGERLSDAAKICDSDSQLDIYNDDLFAELKKRIEEIVEVFQQSGTESWPMWQMVSAEYCDLVYNKAGILLPKIEEPDLRTLADRVALLMNEESDFTRALDELARHMPPVAPGGNFDPESHLDYLQRFPAHAPGSRKVYRRFERFATSEPMKTILKRTLEQGIKQNRNYLPDWVRKYMEANPQLFA